ncbi:hypothetical protein C2134_10745 [Chromobacterium sinusclupearum]|uniref:Uncharacterized protein n=1 Tax=Chromobacterium sinusclupearum TaxID=2077146 RepID=A0A2K4MNT0_9NEIS|nr:hypothetical protein BI343_00365 [Chromobacterium amazonense]POA98682.1 hypothetical protein C2134_10745 [Chromobacterium sinusclupearum]
MMGLALKTLLTALESQRIGNVDSGAELDMPTVRVLEVPLDLTACRELRVLAHVFNGEQSALAAAVLRAALLDMQAHLDDELDQLAHLARNSLDDCQS